MRNSDFFQRAIPYLHSDSWHYVSDEDPRDLLEILDDEQEPEEEELNGCLKMWKEHVLSQDPDAQFCYWCISFECTCEDCALFRTEYDPDLFEPVAIDQEEKDYETYWTKYDPRMDERDYFHIDDEASCQCLVCMHKRDWLEVNPFYYEDLGFCEDLGVYFDDEYPDDYDDYDEDFGLVFDPILGSYRYQWETSMAEELQYAAEEADFDRNARNRRSSRGFRKQHTLFNRFRGFALRKGLEVDLTKVRSSGFYGHQLRCAA